MKHFALKSLTVAALALAAAPSFAQGNQTNNSMTNIVQVQGNCDIVAIGVDFGVINSPTVASGTPVVTANTAIGNAGTGTSHNMKGYDGTGGSNQDISNPTGTNPDGSSRKTNDDTLALKGSIFQAPLVGATISGTLSTVVSQIPNAIPGVYVSCSTAPDRIYVTSGNSAANITIFGTGAPPGGTVVDVSGDATALPGALTGALPLTVGFNPAFSLNSTLNYAPAGTPTAAPGPSEMIDYSLRFSPTSVNIALQVPGVPAVTTGVINVPATPPQTLGTFLGVYPAAGFIRTDGQPAREGDFADIAVATVEY